MNYCIVFNHPYEGSYCAAVLAAVRAGISKAGDTCDVIHLDNDGFNPVMTAQDLRGYQTGTAFDPMVKEYQRRIARADYLILIFPIWWELMPAMMKGFLDKVLLKGFAFTVKEKGILPGFSPALTNLRGVTMITTMNTPAPLYRLLFGNAVRKAVFNGTFRKIGIRNLRWINLACVKSAKHEQRERWLRDLEAGFAHNGI